MSESMSPRYNLLVMRNEKRQVRLVGRPLDALPQDARSPQGSHIRFLTIRNRLRTKLLVLNNPRADRNPPVIDSRATRETSLLDPRPRQQNFVELNKKHVDGNTLFVGVDTVLGAPTRILLTTSNNLLATAPGLLTATSDLLTGTADLLTATSNVLTATPDLLPATPNVLTSTKFC